MRKFTEKNWHHRVTSILSKSVVIVAKMQVEDGIYERYTDTDGFEKLIIKIQE